MMAFFESDEDVGIAGPDGSRRAVGEIDTAVGQADVVDDALHFLRRNHLADQGLHVIAQSGCLLDAQPGPRTQVQLDLPRIHHGEEVLAESRQVC